MGSKLVKFPPRISDELLAELEKHLQSFDIELINGSISLHYANGVISKVHFLRVK